MQKLLNNIFKENNIQAYYITRKANNKFPCVVYNFSEQNSGMSDDEEELTQRTIYINIYHKDNMIEYKNKIQKIMSEAGFIRKSYAVAFWDSELECYELPMIYSYIYDM